MLGSAAGFRIKNQAKHRFLSTEETKDFCLKRRIIQLVTKQKHHKEVLKQRHLLTTI